MTKPMPVRRHPVFSDNAFKLGVFATNGRGAMSIAPEARRLDWEVALQVARTADAAGWEAIVPFARWKGYVADQPMHVTGDVMDPYTFAAAIAQATRDIGVFVTSHAPVVHPAMAAKQLATIDVISHGRAALNVVGGWNRPELEMFGAPLKEHDLRYDHLSEWLSILEKFWTCDRPFDFEGDFYKIQQGVSLPHPLQQPRMPIMNAGGSDRGKSFACEHADLCFVILKGDDPDQIRAEVASYRSMARERFGRDVKVWTYCFMIQRPSDREAQEFLDYVAVEQQDHAAVDGWIGMQLQEAKLMPPHILKGLRTRVAAGGGGFPLVGSPDTIVEKIRRLSECGLDGTLVTWIDFEAGIAAFDAEVMPRLTRAGLREAVRK
jgi:alkanesulfonate monooxygenase SsuD/methylene tetrahydromethanopterin reductase-like flavin-dependent oxidoreductase (luciferase family)